MHVTNRSARCHLFFIFSFSCLLIVYISGGILVNVYVKHIKGKEAFPNYTFWVDLPFLVKVCNRQFLVIDKLRDVYYYLQI